MKVRLDLRRTVYLCRFHHRLLQESEQNFFSRRPGFCTTGFPQKRQGFAATESSVGLFRSIGAFGFFTENVDDAADSLKDDLESRVIVTGKEGKRIAYYTTKYERKPQNRDAAIRIHGYKCAVCGFDYAERYGDLGKGFIEVHHIKPLYSLDEEITPDPATDMVCLCANCHRMIHRRKDDIMTVEELSAIVEKHQ